MSSQPKAPKTIILGNRPLRDYLLESIVSLNRESDVIEILGRGRHIYRAVNLYNMLSSRLGDRISIKNVEIGSMLIRNRRVSYIKITIQRI
ncbi:Alba, DNA/RNA-binding protein [Ignisphaera aggregans DSM 17230]|uniref:Alba, DNA/RNA-binding protein n=1 Tax=Ignisphaera aggregans (strain DSM 17230 / JCM 13409 / AQ1.S1) TaxID=583356 RepID=E0SQB5_IGNAA|nr:Alba, DNA/RNA-binding protein [Ignisphaera aggregans DSM 17230]